MWQVYLWSYVWPKFCHAVLCFLLKNCKSLTMGSFKKFDFFFFDTLNCTFFGTIDVFWFSATRQWHYPVPCHLFPLSCIVIFVNCIIFTLSHDKIYIWLITLIFIFVVILVLQWNEFSCQFFWLWFSSCVLDSREP